MPFCLMSYVVKLNIHTRDSASHSSFGELKWKPSERHNNKNNKITLFRCQRYLAKNANWGHLQDRIGIWMCWFLRRGENRSTRRKTSWSKDENQQQTQPTYDTGTGNRTRATLVGGERSHHCAIPAPHNK